MKKTPWFDGSVKPTRKELYERNGTFWPTFSYFNGNFWGSYSANPVDAFNCRRDPSRFQDLPWRGLTKPM